MILSGGFAISAFAPETPWMADNKVFSCFSVFCLVPILLFPALTLFALGFLRNEDSIDSWNNYTPIHDRVVKKNVN
jgi:hypothetical protein